MPPAPETVWAVSVGTVVDVPVGRKRALISAAATSASPEMTSITLEATISN